MRNTISSLAKRISSGALARAGAATLVSALLSGCGLNGEPGLKGITPLNPSGSVHGGQQPVSGALIQLYSVGTTGSGSPSTALIGSTVTTNQSGIFTLPAYSCAAATQVYITATGGDPGEGTNSNLSEMAVLGPCSSLSSSTFININELTTVAAAYALAPFMSDYLHVGATGSNPPALVNAFNTANLLINFSSGVSPTPPSGMILPVKQLNTVADILASCVNTTGATSATCTTLFAATGKTDTIGAALAMAKNPGSSAITALFSLQVPTPPFQPALSSQPNDFTMPISYTGPELSTPYGIAIDATGSAWVTNESGSSVVKAPTPSTAFATTTYGAGGLIAPRGISLDRAGNVWIANTGGNNVVKLTSGGVVVGSSPFSDGGISAPVAIANDSAGNAWIANFNAGSISELGSTGTAVGSSPFTGSGAISSPLSVALDSNGGVLIGNAGTGQLCIFSNAAVFQSCVDDGQLFGATAVAVSRSGNVSMSGMTSGSAVAGAFTLATNTGTVIANSPGLGGGLTLPVAVAYDGAGNTWFANNNSISEFGGLVADSPSTGLGSLNSPAGIAVDASGNIWTTNSGDNSITIFVGLGTPVVTPLAANVGP